MLLRLARVFRRLSADLPAEGGQSGVQMLARFKRAMIRHSLQTSASLGQVIGVRLVLYYGLWMLDEFFISLCLVVFAVGVVEGDL